ncbi:hypothetical protein OHO83_42810 [Streptomyces sp. NBC_00569]|uniref:hypothetical protein n=1 Tax=unclassified Streptomyces TaxID=2593676 RepID=UPI00225064A8|nr:MULTISPECIES: hypothetical protein [unclassified Streptomyces]MCX5443080.1 hypothetical protein [Streptomyces sp. NBC_00063]WUB98503.1 hypothetical protein OHO83_42810 [Streptomyces sp. NBC_00569]
MSARCRADSLGLLDREMPDGACLQGGIGDPAREFAGVIERGGEIERRSGLPAALGASPEGLTTTGSPVLSRPWQLLGLPTFTVPGRTNDQGMPFGLQLVGPPDRLDHLFELGHALETAARARRAD